jgi:hypothetical protein
VQGLQSQIEGLEKSKAASVAEVFTVFFIQIIREF